MKVLLYVSDPAVRPRLSAAVESLFDWRYMPELDDCAPAPYLLPVLARLRRHGQAHVGILTAKEAMAWVQRRLGIRGALDWAPCAEEDES